jgi:hypothetical protein
MGLLLDPDPVALYEPAGEDGHGWALPGDGPPVWSGRGNLQPAPGGTDRTAADGGGHGPHDPAAHPSAVLYLPPAAPVAEGMVAEVGGRLWALSQVRRVTDPRGLDDLDCWTATATGAV